jgi:hypothetical protein
VCCVERNKLADEPAGVSGRGGQWVSHVVDRDSVRHGEHELGVLMPAVHHDGG